MRTSTQQTTYDERLRISVGRGGPAAVNAAVVLMERHDPVSLEEALELVACGAELPPGCQEAVAEAWDRYFHITNMSWD
jgi:hypothetical protein